MLKETCHWRNRWMCFVNPSPKYDSDLNIVFWFSNIKYLLGDHPEASIQPVKSERGQNSCKVLMPFDLCAGIQYFQYEIVTGKAAFFFHGMFP